MNERKCRAAERKPKKSNVGEKTFNGVLVDYRAKNREKYTDGWIFLHTRTTHFLLIFLSSFSVFFCLSHFNHFVSLTRANQQAIVFVLLSMNDTRTKKKKTLENFFSMVLKPSHTREKIHLYLRTSVAFEQLKKILNIHTLAN